MPMIRGSDVPSGYRTAPPKRPWFDSTRPIAASSGHWMPQLGSADASRAAARRYALSAMLGMPLAARPASTGLVAGAGCATCTGLRGSTLAPGGAPRDSISGVSGSWGRAAEVAGPPGGFALGLAWVALAPPSVVTAANAATAAI